MDRPLSQTEIKEFIESNGLDKDMLDESDEALEAWGLKWEGQNATDSGKHCQV